jgi:hypothetical protein
VSCWLVPAASQIPVQSWAARETSSHPVVRVSPQVMCRITVPSRRAIACTMPSGSVPVRPCTGTVQCSRLRSPVWSATCCWVGPLSVCWTAMRSMAVLSGGVSLSRAGDLRFVVGVVVTMTVRRYPARSPVAVGSGGDYRLAAWQLWEGECSLTTLNFGHCG